VVLQKRLADQVAQTAQTACFLLPPVLGEAKADFLPTGHLAVRAVVAVLATRRVALARPVRATLGATARTTAGFKPVALAVEEPRRLEQTHLPVLRVTVVRVCRRRLLVLPLPVAAVAVAVLTTV